MWQKPPLKQEVGFRLTRKQAALVTLFENWKVSLLRFTNLLKNKNLVISLRILNDFFNDLLAP